VITVSGNSALLGNQFIVSQLCYVITVSCGSAPPTQPHEIVCDISCNYMFSLFNFVPVKLLLNCELELLGILQLRVAALYCNAARPAGCNNPYLAALNPTDL